MIYELLGEEMTFTHVLTHIRRNGTPSYSPEGFIETSVMQVWDGELVENTFELIPHGWNDWKKASKFIKGALNKGWGTDKIYDTMCDIEEREHAGEKPITY